MNKQLQNCAQSTISGSDSTPYQIERSFSYRLNFFIWKMKRFFPLKNLTVCILAIFCMLLPSQLKATLVINNGGTVTWGTGGIPFPANYETGISITSNAGTPTKLIINGGTLSMLPNKTTGSMACWIITDISVGPGCVLILNGVTINLVTSRLCSGNTYTTVADDVWDGIKATGTRNGAGATVAQYDQLPTATTWGGVIRDYPNYTGSDPQTYVEINGGSISRAVVAVSSIDGAIIRADGVTFEDNDIGCSVTTYYGGYFPNPNPSLPAIPADNASYFNNCIFKWSYDNTTFTTYHGIHLEGIRETRIGGCTFENNDPVVHCYNDRGTGIYADQATFTATGSGTSFVTDEIGCPENGTGGNPGDGCIYRKLSYGIFFIDASGSDENSFKAKRSKFTKNWISIYAENAYLPIIYNNEFNTAAANGGATSTRSNYNSLFGTGGCAANTLANTTNGVGAVPAAPLIEDVHLFECKRFDVYNNKHEFADVDVHHIVIEDAVSEHSRLQNNDCKNTSGLVRSSSDDVRGISFIYSTNLNGDDQKVEVICNNFTNLGIDIDIKTGVTTASVWESPTNKASGNVFSSNTGSRLRIRNAGSAITTYRYTIGNSIENPSLSSSGTVNASTANAPTSCTLDCDHLLAKVTKTPNAFKTVLIFPNPANNQVNIECKSANISEVFIYNLHGQLLYSKQCANQNNAESISLKDYSQGLYIIKVKLANGNVLNQKLMISN